MAIIRCDIHPVRQDLARQTYVQRIEPVGYPQSAAICGTPSCRKVGLVWLNEDEYHDYQRGERIFNVKTHTVKIEVSDRQRGLPA